MRSAPVEMHILGAWWLSFPNYRKARRVPMPPTAITLSNHQNHMQNLKRNRSLRLWALVLVLCLAFFGIGSKSVEIEMPQGIECIHAGAVWGTDASPQLIILVETHNHRFLFGNAWDNRWSLYSNYLREGGGTPAEVLAYVRGQGYTYRGKAK